MALRGLRQFLNFNFEKFSEGKFYVVNGTREYKDFDTQNHLGVKVDCYIALDETKYRSKNGEQFTNLGKPITFKVSKDVEVPLGSRVMPKNVVATVWGKFNNELSVECSDIVVIQPAQK